MKGKFSISVDATKYDSIELQLEHKKIENE